MKKTVAFVVVVLSIFAGYFYQLFQNQDQSLGAASNQLPTFYSASSTVYTLTTASQRLLATSTQPKRLAATIQPISCTGAPSAIFLNLGRDVAATGNSGLAVYASTTMSMSDYTAIPVVVGSVQGITAGGTCTVLVTEWRSQD